MRMVVLLILLGRTEPLNPFIPFRKYPYALVFICEETTSCSILSPTCPLPQNAVSDWIAATAHCETGKIERRETPRLGRSHSIAYIEITTANALHGK